MSDYEGLDYEARVDAAMDDVLGREGWCGVCGGWSPANPPMCDLCGVRLCGRCAVEYPDGDILVAESPHHSIAGAALLGAWEDANGLRHCLVRVLAVAPDKAMP